MSQGLVLSGLHAMRGEQEVLRGVDLEVSPGQVCALMGVSGTGKSTVLRAIAALQPFSAGRIMVNGFTLQAGPLPPQSKLKELRSKVGMVFQAHSLFEHLTVLENVILAPIHVLGWTRARACEVALRLLNGLGVSGRAGMYPRDLSGGEAQRVAIARALAPDPTMLLLDEPTSALDPARRGALGSTLQELARQGRGLLIATHDVDFARAHTDRVLVLSHGVVVEQGSAKEVLDQPKHAATVDLLRGPRAEN
jgi:polar amino acid transport system ATP-binding protein